MHLPENVRHNVICYFEQEKWRGFQGPVIRQLDLNTEVLAHLHQDGILGEKQRDELLDIPQASRRRRKFVQLFPSCTYRGRSPFDRFLYILKETGQKDLSEQLKRGKFEHDMKREQMKWKIRLQKCEVQFTKDIPVKQVVTHLHDKAIVWDDDVERLLHSGIAEPDQRMHLFRLLSRKWPVEKSTFEDILRACGASHLADLFSNVVISEGDISQLEGNGL